MVDCPISQGLLFFQGYEIFSKSKYLTFHHFQNPLIIDSFPTLIRRCPLHLGTIWPSQHMRVLPKNALSWEPYTVSDLASLKFRGTRFFQSTGNWKLINFNYATISMKNPRKYDNKTCRNWYKWLNFQNCIPISVQKGYILCYYQRFSSPLQLISPVLWELRSSRMAPNIGSNSSSEIWLLIDSAVYSILLLQHPFPRLVDLDEKWTWKLRSKVSLNLHNRCWGLIGI